MTIFRLFTGTNNVHCQCASQLGVQSATPLYLKRAIEQQKFKKKAHSNNNNNTTKSNTEKLLSHTVTFRVQCRRCYRPTRGCSRRVLRYTKPSHRLRSVQHETVRKDHKHDCLQSIRL